MQEIELSSPRVLSLDIEFYDKERKNQYKKILRSKYKELIAHQKDTLLWSLVNTQSRVQLYEHAMELKSDVILNCSAERLYKIYTDTSPVTRILWDKQECIRQIEDFDDIIVLEKTIVKNHYLLGIQWNRFKNNMYTILFTTCTHPIHDCPNNKINVKSSSLVLVKPIDQNSCYMSTVNQYDNIQVFKHYRKHLIDIPLMYENVCNQRYEEIYNMWICATCGIKNEPTTLECKGCHVARYWKCLHKGCRQLQPDNNETNICRYCRGDNSEL